MCSIRVYIKEFLMQKYITLSLFILSFSFAHAMEIDFCFSSNRTSNESKLISDLRASKNEFEKQLQLYKPEQKYPFSLQRLFSDYRVTHS